jgi:hypothetical protein
MKNSERLRNLLVLVTPILVACNFGCQKTANQGGKSGTKADNQNLGRLALTPFISGYEAMQGNGKQEENSSTTNYRSFYQIYTVGDNLGWIHIEQKRTFKNPEATDFIEETAGFITVFDKTFTRTDGRTENWYVFKGVNANQTDFRTYVTPLEGLKDIGVGNCVYENDEDAGYHNCVWVMENQEKPGFRVHTFYAGGSPHIHKRSGYVTKDPSFTHAEVDEFGVKLSRNTKSGQVSVLAVIADPNPAIRYNDLICGGGCTPEQLEMYGPDSSN